LDFLRQNGVKTVDWLVQSADLNPIENLWAIINSRRQIKYGVPVTIIHLIEQIFAIWDDINIALCTKLSDSISNWLNKRTRLNKY
jgi:uncharacterized membrane protein